jgi:xanthine dehydrogenase accessory factor
MREVLPELMRWYDAGETIGVGTVVATFQSAPRPPGASMLVGPDGEAVGSVSGGCVEGAVYELAGDVVGSGEPVLQRYGISDDDAFAVGLTCGGILDVFVEKVNRESFPELTEIAADIEAGRPVALATVVEHPDPAWLGRRIVVRPDGIVPAEKHPESADSGAGRPSRARSAAPGRTTPWRTTRSGCLRTGATRPWATGRTASDGARACGCSCGRSRRHRGCWCSAPSTSRPRSPGWGRSSATT